MIVRAEAEREVRPKNDAELDDLQHAHAGRLAALEPGDGRLVDVPQHLELLLRVAGAVSASTYQGAEHGQRVHQAGIAASPLVRHAPMRPPEPPLRLTRDFTAADLCPDSTGESDVD